MARLTGKVAVVTGASRGIGAAIAKRLAADGAAVAVNYAQSAGPATELVAQIKAAGGTAAAIQADIRDPAQVRKLFAEVKKNHGHLDILVNNAGVWANAPLSEFTVEHFRNVFDLNVVAVLSTASEALRLFPKSGGRIINITSIAARSPMANGSVYSASKAAVDALSLNWATELGPRNITVNSLAPGLTETEMTAGAPDEFKNAVVDKTPLKRIGQPGDIADVAAFLASDESRWITGQIITASGGLL